jgi:hypothetical protein
MEQSSSSASNKLNLYRLPPKDYSGREDVIVFTDLQKVYGLEGREDKVVALRDVSLSRGSEFYPIKRYALMLIYNILGVNS